MTQDDKRIPVLVEDWAPTGELRDVLRYYVKKKWFGEDDKRITGHHLEQKWSRTLIKNTHTMEWVTETEWRAVPVILRELGT